MNEHLVVDTVSRVRYVDYDNPDQDIHHPMLNSASFRFLKGSLLEEKVNFLTLVPKNDIEFQTLLADELKQQPNHELLSIPTDYEVRTITNMMKNNVRVDRKKQGSDGDISLNEFSKHIVDLLKDDYKTITMTGYIGKIFKDTLLSLKLIGPLFYFASDSEKYSDLERIAKNANLIVLKNDDLRNYSLNSNTIFKIPKILINVRHNKLGMEIQYIHSAEKQLNSVTLDENTRTDLSSIRLSLFNSIHDIMKYGFDFPPDYLEKKLIPEAVNSAILTSLLDPSSSNSELFSTSSELLRNVILAAQKHKLEYPSGLLNFGPHKVRVFYSSKHPVGGDLYLIENRSPLLRLTMGDIESKGVEAAINTNALKYSIEHAYEEKLTIDQIANKLESKLSNENAPKAVMSFMDFKINAEDKLDIKYLNCAQYIYVFSKDDNEYKITCYDAISGPLGYFGIGSEAKSFELDLSRSENYVLLLSDGLFEQHPSKYNVITDQFLLDEQQIQEMHDFSSEKIRTINISQEQFEKVSYIYNHGLNTLQFKKKLEDDATMLLLYFGNNKT